VLNRVSNAISNFIAPISSQQTQSSINKQEKPFEKHGEKNRKKNPPKEKPKEEAELKLQTSPTTEQAANVTTQTGDQSSLVGLLCSIQKKKEELLRWLGTQNYSNVSSKQCKASKLNKGAMLDYEAK
jgi:hypothetical protein